MELLAVCIMFMCLCVDNMVMANMSGMKRENDNVRSRFSLRIALTFSLAHALFLIFGYLIAWLMAPSFPGSAAAGAWIAFAFVALIGIRLLLETVEKSPSFASGDPEVNSKLIKTSILLALNSAMLGFAMSAAGVEYNFLIPALMLFAVSMAFSLTGFLIGKPDAKKISTKMAESAAGIIMIILAVRLLYISL